MPTGYFDPAEEANIALVPPDIRRDENFASLASVVEEDVLAAYRIFDAAPGYRTDLAGSGFLTDWSGAYVVPGNVYLYGYALDPAAADANFARALRREIAEVIRWRWSQHRKQAGVNSETSGDPATSKSYDAGIDRPFPPHFGEFLRAYDRRPVPW